MFRVYFVGCGPGDPELITIKAKKLIQKADVVVYSGSLIQPPILKLSRLGSSKGDVNETMISDSYC